MKLKPFNVIGALWRFLVSLVTRRPPFVTDDVLAHRIAVCHACPLYQYKTGQCLRCTCFVSVKAMLTTEKCPRDLW